MSLIFLGLKMQQLVNKAKRGEYSSIEEVKHEAIENNIAYFAGYKNLSKEETENWYNLLAENIFIKHNNWIPCFADIGFGTELLDHSDKWLNCNVPEKKTVENNRHKEKISRMAV